MFLDNSYSPVLYGDKRAFTGSKGYDRPVQTDSLARGFTACTHKVGIQAKV